MVGVTIVGDAKLIAELATASGNIGFRTAAATRKHAGLISETAKQLVPVGETGDTRDSISAEFEGDGRFTEMTATIGPETFYARFLELGTAKMAPHAFMGPAFDMHAGDYVKALEDIAVDI